MIVAGKKTSGSFGIRSIPAFDNGVEFGVVVPFTDYRFLRSYELNSLDSNHVAPFNEITFNSDFQDNKVPTNYITDLEGNLLRTAFIGPSSSSTNDSRGTYAVRPAKRDEDCSGDFLAVGKDIDDDASSVFLDMNEKDDVIMATEPDLFTSAIGSDIRGVVRKPNMAGIIGHANSYMTNSTGSNMVIDGEITAKASIENDLHYRFSFYYRAKCSVGLSLVLNIVFYNNNGQALTVKTYPTFTLSNNDNEESDFHYFSVAMPSTEAGISIAGPRLKFIITIVPDSSSAFQFEIIYPVLEHAFDMGVGSGFVRLPYAPSGITATSIPSGSLKVSNIGTNMPFDTSKLFATHIGRQMFKGRMEFSLLESTYLNELRILEQMNSMGFLIAIRTDYPKLPPVMIGNIKITNSIPAEDFHYNDVTVSFEEIV